MNEIEKMTIEEVEARTLEIESEVESADEERLTSLKSELDKLEERKTELKKAAEIAQEERNAIAEGTAPIT